MLCWCGGDSAQTGGGRLQDEGGGDVAEKRLFWMRPAHRPTHEPHPLDERVGKVAEQCMPLAGVEVVQRHLVGEQA